MIFIVLAISFLLLLYLSLRRPNKFPPGPRGYPIVGNLFEVHRPRHKGFAKLSETYGDIVGLYFGPVPVVVLNNYKLIREAFNEQVFTGRPVALPLQQRNLGGNRGVLFADGTSWFHNRRFALRNLRDFGFGKKSMEGLVMEEVKELIASFQKEAGKPLVTQNRFNIAVLNALWTILTGDRFDQNDPRVKAVIKSLTTAITTVPLTRRLADFFPIFFYLRRAFPSYFRTPGEEFNKMTYDIIQEIVEQHKETLQEDSSRDFIEVYLKEIQATKDPSSCFYKKEGELTLRVLLLDLFAAGAETTSTTLTWAFLLLALNPEKQEKLFEEIKSVVGMSRNVSLTDRPEMPYLEATIHEVLRFSSLVPLGVAHRALEDVQFHGYTIPKGTTVIGNIYKGNNEKSVWGDPENFRPERFLSKDGKSLVHYDAWMPFAVGKRVCLGETLARDELFLFLGNLVQAFKVDTVPGAAKPNFESLSGGILIPPAHELILLDRVGDAYKN